MLDKIKRLFFWITIPIQKLLQYFSRPEPEMSRDQVDLILNKLLPGDLLLSYEGGRLTSPFIRGQWNHLAVINNNLKVVEAVAPKVRLQDAEEWLFKKKGVAIVRYYGNHLSSSTPINLLVATYVNKFIGWLYDYLFSYGNKRAYCSEIGYLSYLEFDSNFMNHIPKGREILPQDFYDAAKYRLSNLILITEVKN